MAAERDLSRLPGFVKDQPDAYECGDEVAVGVPEEQQKPEEPKEGISTDPIQPFVAQSQFKGKTLVLDPSGKGYKIPTTFEWGGKESPKQRFERLQRELQELQDDIKTAQETVEADPGDEVVPVKLVKEVGFMMDQMRQMKLDQLIGGDSILLSDSPAQQKELSKQLLAEIAKYKSSAQSSAGESESGVTYELFYRPAHEAYQTLAKANELERRVTKMEKTVGTESLEPIAHALEMSELSVQSALQALTTRAQALSEENLSDLDRRLTTILTSLEAASKKKQQIEPENEKTSRVNELYELTKRWDPVVSSMPQVVDRLVSLKTLHEQGAEFGRTLAHLETVQSGISESLATQSATLTTVEESLRANAAKIEANFSSLEKRMDAVWSNLSKLN
eukprot:m.480781 g.480781  ORF g.480781 m.480781 type:complete len:392 (+) comp21951_c0_seq1:95-1270(+)